MTTIQDEEPSQTSVANEPAAVNKFVPFTEEPDKPVTTPDDAPDAGTAKF